MSKLLAAATSPPKIPHSPQFSVVVVPVQKLPQPPDVIEPSLKSLYKIWNSNENHQLFNDADALLIGSGANKEEELGSKRGSHRFKIQTQPEQEKEAPQQRNY